MKHYYKLPVITLIVLLFVGSLSSCKKDIVSNNTDKNEDLIVGKWLNQGERYEYKDFNGNDKSWEVNYADQGDEPYYIEFASDKKLYFYENTVKEDYDGETYSINGKILKLIYDVNDYESYEITTLNKSNCNLKSDEIFDNTDTLWNNDDVAIGIIKTHTIVLSK